MWFARRKHVTFVLLTAGWSGERMLVRLLSASGSVRCSGAVLACPVRRPLRHLRHVLASGPQAHGAIVRPEHLWLTNPVNVDVFLGELVDADIRLISLTRTCHVDRGLSRALCGPDLELLPLRPQMVDPAEVLVFAQDSERAAAWLDSVPNQMLRLVFERDLIDAEARARTADRLVEHLDLPAFAPPQECTLPTSDGLWACVANPDETAAQLRVLR